MAQKDTVKITFEGNPIAIDSFMTWLCEAGEQDYWSAASRMFRDDKPYLENAIVVFDYDFKKGIIKGEVGPLDEEEDDD